MTDGLGRVMVCADDYAISPGVSAGIRKLAGGRRITATSVMTASPFWPEEAAALKPFLEVIDVGLHLTLTDFMPLGPMPEFAPRDRMPSAKKVFWLANRKRLPLAEIFAEIERQFSAFVAAMGRLPAHIDGHHHMHQLPGISDMVLRLYKTNLGNHTAMLRTCCDRKGVILRRGVAPLKSMVISILGQNLYGAAHRHGIPTNSGFAGFYKYDGAGGAFESAFRRFFIGATDRHLIMCHPGYVDGELKKRDSLLDPREDELRFMLGPSYLETLEHVGFRLERFTPR